MRTIYLYSLLCVFAGIFPSKAQVQENNNQEIVKQIYDVLQDKNAFSKDITLLTSGIRWEAGSTKKNHNRNSMSFRTILNKEWDSVLFEDLYFLNDENRIVVTGTVSGKKATECDYISTRFKHSWTIEDGKILAFNE